jgi:hypothetical protein
MFEEYAKHPGRGNREDAAMVILIVNSPLTSRPNVYYRIHNFYEWGYVAMLYDFIYRNHYEVELV